MENSPPCTSLPISSLSFAFVTPRVFSYTDINNRYSEADNHDKAYEILLKCKYPYLKFSSSHIIVNYYHNLYLILYNL